LTPRANALSRQYRREDLIMADEDKPAPAADRRWAIEQAIKMHHGSGTITEWLLGEAEKLLEFVADKK